MRELLNGIGLVLFALVVFALVLTAMRRRFGFWVGGGLTVLLFALLRGCAGS